MLPTTENKRARVFTILGLLLVMLGFGAFGLGAVDARLLGASVLAVCGVLHFRSLLLGVCVARRG